MPHLQHHSLQACTGKFTHIHKHTYTHMHTYTQLAPMLTTTDVILQHTYRRAHIYIHSQLASMSNFMVFIQTHGHVYTIHTHTHTHTQLAPMSTTTDISTAISYSISQQSLIFKILTKNRLQRGADLSFLSAAPTEAEVLFPPLTYLQPTGRTQTIELNNHSFTVVEVTPTLA